MIVYKCVVCGKEFSKREGLAGHMGHHKDVEFRRLSVRFPRERLDWFLDYCQRHNTTSCHLLLTFFDMLEAGEKTGSVVVGSPNPTVFVLNQHFASRPRGHGKYDFPRLFGSGCCGDEGECFICGKPAVVECFSPGTRRVPLCKRHCFYKNMFEQYRVLG